MARQDTCKEKKAAQEDQQNLQQWEEQLRSTLMSVNMDLICKLVQEGVDNGYPMNKFMDSPLVRYFLNHR